MPRGASPKRERQYEHIKQSARKSGRYGARAAEVAARTVNKIRREKGETKTRGSKSRSTKSRSRGSRPRSRKATTASRGKRKTATRRAASGGRGFAGMSDQRQREIAAAGGRAAHKRGTAHEFSPAEARRAGQKGGEAVSRDRGHMARIGRLGGER
jgi:uncharacterized protein